MDGDFDPCEAWPVIWQCDVTSDDDALQQVAVDAATQVLYALTGRQFGSCQVTLRPCRDSCQEVPWPGGDWALWPGRGVWPQPALIAGLWYNLTCGSCGTNCSCTTISEVTLPAPVMSVQEVRVDGQVLVTGAYRVDDNRTLVRIDGGVWPRCNDLSRADTQTGTWSVTATYGREVPTLARIAMGELACEFMRGLRGEDCRLPRQLASLTRQGVSIQFPNVTELLTEGRLGLYFGDLAIATYNPSHLHRRARTFSIDRATPRRVGT